MEGQALPQLILCVDDFPPQRYARSAILRAAGFEVIEAGSGRSALALAREHHPDLLLLDVYLPDLDGLAVCRELKADAATADILVLHVSATFRDAEARVRALDNGADGYLAEPLEPDELKAQVRSLLRLGRAEREAEAARRSLEESLRGRKLAEEALRVSEERLEEALLASPSFAFEWEPASDVVRRSRSCEGVLGLTGDEAVHDTGEAFFQRVHPADRSALASMLHSLRPDAGSYSVRYRVIRPDGAVVVLEESGRGDFDASGTLTRLIGVTTDVTAREAAEEARRRMEERLRIATDAASLGIHDFDVTSGRVEWDTRVRALFGVDESEPITYEVFLSGVHPDDREAVEVEMTRALDPAGHGRYEREYRAINRKTGAERWVFATGQTFFEGGRPVRLVGTVQDITGQKQIEAALREANEQLRAADRRKDEFIAVLSHELRNPLAPIRFALPLLSTQPLNDAGGRALTVVERQVDHLTRLVDDLLTASRIASGRLDLRAERLSLQSVVSAGIEGTSPALVACHAVKVVMPDDPIWVHADPERLAQVVTNLLDNSAKYTPPGGDIVIEAAREGDRAIIRVRDSGVGIAPEALPHVFEMFWQVAPEKGRSGLGIGLALVKRLVEMHGGRVEARSAGLGQGTQFVVDLPLAAPLEEESSGRRREGLAVRRLSVLVVDDNQDLLEMLSVVVQTGGHDVRKAGDGQTALSAAREFLPDVVLLDVGLPDMSGLEVARALRDDPATMGIRLVALTGWGQAEDRRETAAAGFDYHLTKPADPETLLQLLAMLGSVA